MSDTPRLLTTQLMLEGTLAHTYYTEPECQDRRKKPEMSKQDAAEINTSVEKIHALAKVFEGAVWYLGGLQEKVNACDTSGMSGQADGWSVLLYAIAGRCMITLRDDETKQSLTLITADDEEPFTRLKWGSKSMGPMGIQGLDCTEETAVRLLAQTIRSFPEIQASKEVSIA